MRPLRIGILATEFFDERLGGFGGFGFAARRMAELLISADVPIETVFIAGRGYDGQPVNDLGGTEILHPTGVRHRDMLLHRRAAVDVIITIDWRPGYRYVSRVSPRSDLIVWIHAPVAIAQQFLMDSVRDSLHDSGRRPVSPLPRSNLGSVLRESLAIRRKVRWATTSPALVDRFAGAHHVVPSYVDRLGYGLEIQRSCVPHEAPIPTVLVLGRLAAEKRPWLISDIARNLPDVMFRVAGGGDVDLLGPVPPNIELLGHLDASAKSLELQRSWVLLNTSVNEGLPISFIEALMAGVPLISTVNPDGVTSRFGSHIESVAGRGLELVEPLTTKLGSLINAGDRRATGDSGMRWAKENHSPYAFYRDLSQILHGLGHRRHASALLEVAMKQLLRPSR